MRFFSNDARDSADDQIQEDRPERVQSDPVAVPNQRPPSPWAKTPEETTDGKPEANGRQDDTVDTTPVDGEPAADERDNGTRTDTDEADRPFHEPGTSPTAFGASTVGGAVGASATANPEESVDRSAGNTYASSTVSPVDGHDSADALDLPLDDADARDTASRDTASRDSAPTDDGGFEDPKAVDPATDKVLDDAEPNAEPNAVPDAEPDAKATHAEDSTDDDKATDDDATHDDKFTTDDKAVADSPDTVTAAGAETTAGSGDGLAADKPTADKPAADESAADESAAEEAIASDSLPPVVAAVPVPAAAVAKSDALFAADDARSFQERWRDVQLRFVDSPKDAAADAAKLVDEAMDKLSATLKAQRDGLSGDSEDTEALRVQLRGYREILNRILAL